MCCFLRYLKEYTVGTSTKHATVIVETNFEILEPWNLGTNSHNQNSSKFSKHLLRKVAWTTSKGSADSEGFFATECSVKDILVWLFIILSPIVRMEKSWKRLLSVTAERGQFKRNCHYFQFRSRLSVWCSNFWFINLRSISDKKENCARKGKCSF